MLVTSILTLWERAKMLVTSIFFLFPQMFSSLLTAPKIISSISFFVCECFNLVHAQILSIGKELTLCQTIPTFNHPERETF